jgi:acetyl esterase/lipase
MDFKPLAFDAELAPALDTFRERQKDPKALVPVTAEDRVSSLVRHEERTIIGPDNNEIILSIFRRKEGLPGVTDQTRIGVYHIHGGGMVYGNRFLTVQWPLQAVEKFDAVCVSVEYRLAPQNPDPAPIEDCYAGLVWVAQHAEELGFPSSRMLLNGVSAGGGLAAGVALLARDRKGPSLIGMNLFAPMLDDRSDSLSTHQMEGLGVWDRAANLMGWTALLGERRGTANVSIYASPARATDLSGLPPTYVEVGAVETFRDEVLEFSGKLSRDGVACELHMWPGAYHGFDFIAPTAKVSLAAIKAKTDWLERLLDNIES